MGRIRMSEFICYEFINVAIVLQKAKSAIAGKDDMDIGSLLEEVRWLTDSVWNTSMDAAESNYFTEAKQLFVLFLSFSARLMMISQVSSKDANGTRIAH